MRCSEMMIWVPGIMSIRKQRSSGCSRRLFRLQEPVVRFVVVFGSLREVEADRRREFVNGSMICR